MDRLGWPSEGRERGKSRSHAACRRSRVSARTRKSSTPMPPRKASTQSLLCPYRTPTPVGRGSSPQVHERPSVKELGKVTPYLRKKGSLSSLLASRQGARRPQDMGSSDCLPTTQVSAN